ncbi:MAG: hypothetical protein R3E76_09620 [Planctomycetota bacterium]
MKPTLTSGCAADDFFIEKVKVLAPLTCQACSGSHELVPNFFSGRAGGVAGMNVTRLL